MSTALHLLPLVATILLWFASTALVAWLAHRPPARFKSGLVVAGAVAVAGLALMVAVRDDPGLVAAYASFAGALAVWGWQELAFLTGAVAGPRREAATPGLRGRARFSEASAAVIHHELALAATALLLGLLTWGAANQTGTIAFALLLVLRLSAKLNIFAGVPNFSDELLPRHLHYLRSYFGVPRLRPALLLSILATTALAAWLGARALAEPSAGASLLFALAALGALEHLFLALPVRDGALWRWAIPAQTGKA